LDDKRLKAKLVLSINWVTRGQGGYETSISTTILKRRVIETFRYSA
jgi:hypothetical protein